MSRRIFFILVILMVVTGTLQTPNLPVRAGPALLAHSEPIIVNHRHTDISQIPDAWITEARKLVVHYAHTSHGGQILSGLENLESVDAKYNIQIKYTLTGGWDNTALRFYDGNNYGGDNYITPEMYWESSDGIAHTRSVVETGTFDFSLWTWCGQMSSYSPQQVNTYLNTLDQFETDYPSIGFIYYTGHTDGSSPSGTLWRNNNTVRSYVYANNKALLDFADIESYDPSGKFYPNASDACDWCEDWCTAHPADCQNLPSTCDHAHPLQCKLKAQAFWWLMARLAGWGGPTPGPIQTLTTRSQAANDGWILESGENSNQGGTVSAGAATFYAGDNAADRQYRSILSFNTAGLPDNAVITNVTLKIKRQGLVGVDPLNTHGNLLVDVRGRAYSNNNALQANDFQAAANLNAGGVFNKTLLSGNWYQAVLKSAAIPYINLTGVTQLRLRFQKDDNDDLGADYLKFYSGDTATAAYRPQLIIEYTLP